MCTFYVVILSLSCPSNQVSGSHGKTQTKYFLCSREKGLWLHWNSQRYIYMRNGIFPFENIVCPVSFLFTDARNARPPRVSRKQKREAGAAWDETRCEVGFNIEQSQNVGKWIFHVSGSSCFYFHTSLLFLFCFLCFLFSFQWTTNDPARGAVMYFTSSM